MKRILNYFCIVFIITAVTLYSGDTWLSNTRLNLALDRLVQENTITEFEPIDIASTPDNNLLILARGTVPVLGGLGASQKTIIASCNLQNYKTTTSLIESLSHAHRLYLISNSYVLDINQSQNGPSVIYKVESGFVSFWFKEVKKYDFEQIKIVGEYPVHYWVCSQNKCYLYESEKEVANLDKDNKEYIPQSVGIEPAQLKQKTLTEWTIYNNSIKKLNAVSTENKESEKKVEEEAYRAQTQNDSLAQYNNILLFPYSPQASIVLAQKDQTPVIVHTTLTKDTYSTLPLETPDGLLKLILHHKGWPSEVWLYALVKDPLQRPIILAAQLNKLVEKATANKMRTVHPSTPQTSSVSIPTSSASTTDTRKRPHKKKSFRAPAPSASTTAVTNPAIIPPVPAQQQNNRKQAIAYLKKITLTVPNYTIEEDETISEQLQPDENFNAIGWDKDKKTLTNEKIQISDFKWELNNQNNTIIVVGNNDKKPYFINTRRKMIKFIPISDTEGFAQGQDGRVYSIKLIDIPNATYGVAYSKELQDNNQSFNAQNIILINAELGSIGIINQPFFDQTDLADLGISFKSNNPKKLSKETEKIIEGAYELKPEFLKVTQKKSGPDTLSIINRQPTTANTKPVASRSQKHPPTKTPVPQIPELSGSNSTPKTPSVPPAPIHGSWLSTLAYYATNPFSLVPDLFSGIKKFVANTWSLIRTWSR